MTTFNGPKNLVEEPIIAPFIQISIKWVLPPRSENIYSRSPDLRLKTFSNTLSPYNHFKL